MDIVRIYIYIYIHARYLFLGRVIDFCSFGFTIDGLFFVWMEIGEGGSTLRSTFSPRRASRRRFFVFLKRRVVSFFFFVREWETYCADNLSDLGAHKDRWNGILVVAAANFSVRDDQCYYVKLVLSCLEDLNRSTDSVSRFVINDKKNLQKILFFFLFL